jgi:DNA-binding NarL/FixJ family response regulator
LSRRWCKDGPDPAIATELVLSQRAVEKHINSIFAKLGLAGDQQNHPRVRAALMFLAEGRQ